MSIIAAVVFTIILAIVSSIVTISDKSTLLRTLPIILILSFKLSHYILCELIAYLVSCDYKNRTITYLCNNSCIDNTSKRWCIDDYIIILSLICLTVSLNNGLSRSSDGLGGTGPARITSISGTFV